MGIDVVMECKVLRLLTDADGRIAGAVGYWRPTGEFVTFRAQAVVLGHRRRRQVLEVHVELAGSRPATATRWRCGPGPS